MDKYTEINKLILRHLKQEITPEEMAVLNAWIEESETNRRFFTRINNTPALMAEVRAFNEGKQIDLDAAWARVKATGWEQPLAPEPAQVIKIKWWRYAVAAAALTAIFISVYLLKPANKPVDGPLVQPMTHDAVPNTHKAYLTLDDGKTIVLDSLQTGLLATQGTTQVIKQDDGIISYSGGKAGDQKLIYNKVTVPRGSDVVYLKLSDGSKVWLNAASSIRYPVAFTDDERKVEITGEAYFEVATLPGGGGDTSKRRFVVSRDNISITVLGTRFNVNSYENEENLKVTLLEGSVKVQSEKAEQVIKPGQQAVVNNARINVVNDVDLQQVMAWKEGKFVFINTNIQLIMRQMERWYDLEPTRYENNEVKQWEFNGEISRYSNASRILQLLEKTGSVKFTVEGKKITVKPL